MFKHQWSGFLWCLLFAGSCWLFFSHRIRNLHFSVIFAPQFWKYVCSYLLAILELKSLRKVNVGISSFVAAVAVVWFGLMVAKRNPLRGAFSPHFLWPPIHGPCYWLSFKYNHRPYLHLTHWSWDNVELRYGLLQPHPCQWCLHQDEDHHHHPHQHQHDHDDDHDGQIGACHPWHVLPCKAISAALCQQPSQGPTCIS